MKILIKAFILSVFFTGIFACNSSKKHSRTVQENETKEDEQYKGAWGSSPYAVAPVVIYRMKRDYSQNVPVGMDETGKSIVSYPGQKDLIDKEPLPLISGYWLDNRGLPPNVAFLKYTYNEWIVMKELPSLKTMQENILDSDPLLEMYNCGPKDRFGDDVSGKLIEQIMESERTGKELPFKRIK